MNYIVSEEAIISVDEDYSKALPRMTESELPLCDSRRGQEQTLEATLWKDHHVCFQYGKFFTCNETLSAEGEISRRTKNDKQGPVISATNVV